MDDPENSDSPQLRLVGECCRGFRTKNLDLVAKTLHKDFRLIPYPRSLGRPEETKEEWLERWAGMISLWTTELEVSVLVAPKTAFAATKPLPQQTCRPIVDVPGKVVVHVRT